MTALLLLTLTALLGATRLRSVQSA